MLKQGDIVLIPIPFTDLTSTKRRPVIVISNDAYNQATADIVVAMTSNPVAVAYSLTIDSADLTEGHLNRPSKVRVDKIYTLSQSIVVKRFSQVKQTVLHQIRSLLQDLVSEN